MFLTVCMIFEVNGSFVTNPFKQLNYEAYDVHDGMNDRTENLKCGTYNDKHTDGK